LFFCFNNHDLNNFLIDGVIREIKVKHGYIITDLQGYILNSSASFFKLVTGSNDKNKQNKMDKNSIIGNLCFYFPTLI